MERSAATSFSIFPLSSRRLWWTFIQAFWLRFVIGIQLARQLPQVLARVIQIDNLNRAGKVFARPDSRSIRPRRP